MSGNRIKLNVDFRDFEYAYRRKLYNVEQVSNSEQVLHDVAETYAELIDPWVPYVSGKLRDFQIKEGGQIVYDPVADRKSGRFHYGEVQYYGDPYWRRNRTKHPLATSEWDKVGNIFIWDDFSKKAGDIIRQQLKNEESHSIISRFIRGLFR